MTSRTTKQAARAYQKAHGVPYAEALRAIMKSDDATASPIENPTSQGQSDNPETNWHRKVHFASPEATGLILGEVQSGKTTPNWPALPQEIVLGDLYLSSMLDLRAHAWAGRSTLIPDNTRVPLTWNLRQHATAGPSPVLGVYGTYGTGKSFYLASLVRKNLTGVPTLVVTAHPSNYPEQDGLTYYVPDRDDYGVPAPADPEAVLSVAAERGALAVVYDHTPGSPTEATETLRTLTSQAHGVLLLFASYEEGPGEVVPDITVTPGTATFPPHKGVFQASFSDESPVQMAPTLDHELMVSRGAAENPRRAT